MTCRRRDCPVHRNRAHLHRMADYWAEAHINWSAALLRERPDAVTDKAGRPR